MGIFPWYSDGDPILWWSPDPRLVLFPRELKVSRSLRQVLKNNIYEITMDAAFPEVIRNCASVPKAGRCGHLDYGGNDRCLHSTAPLRPCTFHRKLAGRRVGRRAYGVALGGVFFGESMFTKKNNASKVAFVALVQQLIKWDFALVDCQVTTRHLISFGAREIPRAEFIRRMRKALKMPGEKGNWHKGFANK